MELFGREKLAKVLSEAGHYKKSCQTQELAIGDIYSYWFDNAIETLLDIGMVEAILDLDFLVYLSNTNEFLEETVDQSFLLKENFEKKRACSFCNKIYDKIRELRYANCEIDFKPFYLNALVHLNRRNSHYTSRYTLMYLDRIEYQINSKVEHLLEKLKSEGDMKSYDFILSVMGW